MGYFESSILKAGEPDVSSLPMGTCGSTCGARTLAGRCAAAGATPAGPTRPVGAEIGNAVAGFAPPLLATFQHASTTSETFLQYRIALDTHSGNMRLAVDMNSSGLRVSTQRAQASSTNASQST
ncbi:hypothetical protein [Paraburkholderia sp. Cpub6]|uniref:hypothetical protein n=1 Tax=Paraburkholderia sp. Cpub6 TaxID=2723094 RepID=UPI001612CF02|nr:hypothetical protein [Paraburkholderia sp. Cpub6]MBB5461052.1 hypothetical protein [Paraburkholderia sp. Cpub6]